MKLSRRLETIIAMVKPCGVLADIGCDHAFTSIELVRRGIVKRAVASDVGEGPIEIAKSHVKEAGLSGQIDCRLGNGLATLKENEADAVLITGMGGLLITDILNAGREKLGNTKQLILSPQTEAAEARRAIELLCYRITGEEMLEEDGKYYVVIRAEKEEPGKSIEPMSLLQQKYGPVNLSERNEGFLQYLKHRLSVLEKIGKALQNAQESEESAAKLAEVLAEKAEVMELLNGSGI